MQTKKRILLRIYSPKNENNLTIFQEILFGHYNSKNCENHNIIKIKGITEIQIKIMWQYLNIMSPKNKGLIKWRVLIIWK